MSETKTLQSRIASVMADLRVLHKDGQNRGTGGSWTYVSNDMILSRVGESMAEHGVVIFPSIIETSVRDAETASGKARIDAKVKLVMMVSDVDGNEMSFPWEGAGVDYADPGRAIAKGVTIAHKTFLSKVFCVAGTDEDPDSVDHEAAEPQGQRKAPAPVMASKEQIVELKRLCVGAYADEAETRFGALVKSLAPSGKPEELTKANIEKLLVGVKSKIAEDAIANKAYEAEMPSEEEVADTKEDIPGVDNEGDGDLWA